MLSIDLIHEFFRHAHQVEDVAALEQQEANRQSSMEMLVREQAAVKARSLEQIAAAVALRTKLDKAKAIEKVKELMRQHEATFVHWTHPQKPTLYALAEHAKEVEGSKYGLDF